MPSIVTDGSATSDAHPRVTVDREADPWRWRCPNGHTDWSKTNSHIFCRSCRRSHECGTEITPEHYEIRDARSGELIPWAAVDLVEG